MSEQTVSVFNYNNFRRFLGDYQTKRYATDRSFNKSNVSRLLGLPNTRSYFTDVLRGKRVTDSFIDRFIHMLELDRQEGEYFKVLVHFDQAQTPEEQDFFFNRMVKLNRTPQKKLMEQASLYYAEPHHGTVRALLNIVDFKGSYRDLGAMVFPPLPAVKVRASIRLLLKMNLIRKNASGILRPTEQSITADASFPQKLLVQYQSGCLDLAKQALLKKYALRKNMATNVISISEDGLKRIEARLEEFRTEVRAITHRDTKPADRAYQLQTYLIPIALRKETEK